MSSAIRHILVVDDEDDSHFITRLILKKAGFDGSITSCTSAEQALELLRSYAEPPDLMFVDINMPGLDGFALLTQCEQEGLLPNAHTSVIMCSSSNRPMDMDLAQTFRSVSSYLEKAITVGSYERVVSDHLRRA